MLSGAQRRSGVVAAVAVGWFGASGGCAKGAVDVGAGGGAASAATIGATGSAGQGGSGGSGGQGGANLPCGIDCSTIKVADTCHVAQCNMTTHGCEVIGLADSQPCEDGQFCTIQDACQAGVCTPGGQNTCDFQGAIPQCQQVVCDEPSHSCSLGPGQNASPCTPDDKCQVNGKCSGGSCFGQPKPCFLPPPDDCHQMKCDSIDGVCKPVNANENFPCFDPNDQCTQFFTAHCHSGVCGGGTPIDCSYLNGPCVSGTCDKATGCTTQPANDGKACAGDPCYTMQTCKGGMCQGGMAVQTCDGNGNDGCCPGKCSCNMGPNYDGDCCLYWQQGVLQNVDPAQLIGWSNCYTGTYDVDLNKALVDSITQQKCTGSKLLLACRMVGAPKFQIVAMGDRADVLFDCGSKQTCTHVGNGVGWYFSDSYSWGFVSNNDPVSRNSCDTDNMPNGGLRLCWHTNQNTGGYRCGADLGLNGDSTWERDIFQAP